MARKPPLRTDKFAALWRIAAPVHPIRRSNCAESGYCELSRPRKGLTTHFLFRSLCNQLLKRILNIFQFSGIWLQAHFEIIEDRLLVGFRCGDFLELHLAQHDLVAPDRRWALNHVAHCPLSSFMGAVDGHSRLQ